MVVLAHGDQGLRGDEGCDLGGDQLTGLRVEPRRIGAEEVVVLVVVELGSLSLGRRVLHGQRVQSEALADVQQLLQAGPVEVHPDDGVLLGELFIELLQGEALVHEDARPVTPREGHSTSIAGDAPVGARLAVRDAAVALT